MVHPRATPREEGNLCQICQILIYLNWNSPHCSFSSIFKRGATSGGIVCTDDSVWHNKLSSFVFECTDDSDDFVCTDDSVWHSKLSSFVFE